MEIKGGKEGGKKGDDDGWFFFKFWCSPKVPSWQQSTSLKRVAGDDSWRLVGGLPFCRSVRHRGPGLDGCNANPAVHNEGIGVGWEVFVSSFALHVSPLACPFFVVIMLRQFRPPPGSTMDANNHPSRKRHSMGYQGAHGLLP